MRPQSPKMLQTQTITTTRIISSPYRDTRQDSCSRLVKVTTCQTRPKATITTITNRPNIETRTVILCNDKKCQAHENLIDQLTQENTKLHQRIHDFELQMDKYDVEQQNWMSTAIEIESTKKLLEETSKNHQKEVQYLNSEIYNFKQQCQNQEDNIKSLMLQIKLKQSNEEDITTLTKEVENYKLQNKDKEEQLLWQECSIKDYEKQLQVGQNVIVERNLQIQELQEKLSQYELEFETSNNVIHQLKQEITLKDIQNQQLLLQKDSLISSYKENLDLLEQHVYQQEQHLEGEKNLRLNQLENECEDLNKLILNLQSQLKDLSDQNNQLNQQVNVNDQSYGYLQSSLDLQTKTLELQLQSVASEQEQINQEKFNLKEELYQIKLEVEEKDKLINALKDQIIYHTVSIKEKDDKIEQLHQEVIQQYVQASLYNNEQLQNYLIINEELKNELQLREANEKSKQINLQKEIEIKEQLLQIQNKLNIQVEELQNQKQQLEENYALKEFEIKHLSDLVKSLQQQISEILEDKQILENKILQVQNDHQIEIQQFQEFLLQSKQKEERLTEENLEMKEQLLLQSLEIQRIQSENNNLKGKLFEQLNEMEQLYGQSTKTNQDKQQLEVQLHKQIDQLQVNLQESITQCETLKLNIKKQSELIDELNTKNKFYQAQISHLQEVEAQLKLINEQNNQQQKNLQIELVNKNEIENTLKFKLETLLEDIKLKQFQLAELQLLLQNAEQTNQRQNINLEDKINYLQNEVEMWKEKFVILNKDYHRVQEDLMMVQAEFEAFNKRGQEVKNIKESSLFEVRKSSLYKENIDIKSSQTSIGRLFKENL